MISRVWVPPVVSIGAAKVHANALIPFIKEAIEKHDVAYMADVSILDDVQPAGKKPRWLY